MAALRAKAPNETGPRFWRSFDELAATPDFAESIENEFTEFPDRNSEPSITFSRREILKVMAASAALAGLTGCTKLPTQQIVPYVRQPEQMIAGKPLFYATSMTLGGVATGILVKSHMGRPTKIEGNPDHPASLGASDAFAQAAVLSLYDPDRSQAVVHDGRIGSWNEFQRQLASALEKQKYSQGAGLRILTETITSPSLAAQIQELLSVFPRARWYQYESAGRDMAREGSKIAFGEYVNAVYRVDLARVIVALDADFLRSGPGCVRYAREFALGRRPDDPRGTTNRLYAIEATPSCTGAMADHRLRLRACEVESFTRALARQLGVGVDAGRAISSPLSAAWVSALARDLQENAGACLVVAGDQQPPVVHALAHALNQRLGNFGKTVYFTPPIEASPSNEWQSASELAADLRAGSAEVLVIIGGNPASWRASRPQNEGTATQRALRRETGSLRGRNLRIVSLAYPANPFPRRVGRCEGLRRNSFLLVQPLIAPLYNGKLAACEIVALLNGQAGKSNHDIVQDYWKTQTAIPHGGKVSASGLDPFEEFWKKTLRDGAMENSTPAPKAVTLKADFASQQQTAAPGLEIIFRPDPTTWDGRFANNGWLQELPKPLSKLTWDTVAMFSPETAQRLGLQSEDVVDLQYKGRTVRAPVWVMPGHASESVTVFLGYGRKRAGRVGSGVGFDAGWIRPASTPWFGLGLEVRKAEGRWPLATTQHHSSMEGRDLVRTATLAEYRQDRSFAQKDKVSNPLSLYPEVKHEGYQWGMSIDLNACTGCGACVVACQAENNISVVGKEEVLRGREMHWIRIDRYYEGSLDDPNTYHEPVPCMHCENAPCEVVCPVGATVHSPEGLNEMVYNRCVGTRYCSNNCPYKVRRFNFRLFSDWNTPSLFGLRNPNVTVRSRGVMEKCTYCVQRINAAKIDAEKEDRTVRDGEIVTACQQACPSEAIVFGNIADANSQVSKQKAKTLTYSLLEELNTRPRTTYQARLRNPNPAIATP